eukprot:TRINITY_DN71813_c0_g1_i2.p1 TRINITY_DN71813_c0_g1~~TRINITY_DN71813_c0_g1_i2.p1  ORF type:complete len:220 (-),score=36.64 TRINITY_DN71813_c0_g1_i2:38-634(-)
MGASSSADEQKGGHQFGADVVLHVYDLGPLAGSVNPALRALGTGAFHVGLEIYGVEYSFSVFVENDSRVRRCSGITYSIPRRNADFVYRESVELGRSVMSQLEVLDLIGCMAAVWRSEKYDVLTRNCCHFCTALSLELGVDAPPFWVSNLASTGAAIFAAMEFFVESGDGADALPTPREAPLRAERGHSSAPWGVPVA